MKWKICRPAIYRSGFKCGRCNKSYTSKNIFLDLTVTSGMKEYVEVKPGGTELFRYLSDIFFSNFLVSIPITVKISFFASSVKY